MIEMKKIQKLSYLVNTIILGCLLLGLFSFYTYDITYMVYLCVSVLPFYALFYYFIYKQMLSVFVVFIYIILSLYMIAATLCLGFSSGFHL